MEFVLLFLLFFVSILISISSLDDAFIDIFGEGGGIKKIPWVKKFILQPFSWVESPMTSRLLP